MRCAIYGRVSTAEQSTEMQLEELRAYCQRRGWEITEEYTDAGVSGSRESRPALNRLLADSRRRRFDAVLVYRYDRFARSLRQLVNALSEFDALGIHFVSLHEGVDTSTPNGRLVFGIFGSIAEFERELIRSRVRSGLAAARPRGKRLGRPRVTVDTRRIAALRNEGLSWATIAERMGIGEGTVYRAFQASAKIPTPAASASRCERSAD
jgi:DNA invertase Pin-like site-specific DNA recombinase